MQKTLGTEPTLVEETINFKQLYNVFQATFMAYNGVAKEAEEFYP